MTAVLERLQRIATLIHGEVTDRDRSFDREAVLGRAPPLTHYPALRIVLEHITTAAAAFVARGASDRVARSPRST
jgi:dihydroorotase